MNKNSDIHGIGGWLLLLCIWLTIISPLFSFAELHKATSDTRLYFGLACAVFTFITGVLLWAERPIAWPVAIIYFWSMLGIAWLALLLENSPEQILRALIASVRNGVWLLYLYTSKRVLNTYIMFRWKTSAIQPSSPFANPKPLQELDGELRTLAKLRDDGIITEEDFNSKKQKILGL